MTIYNDRLNNIFNRKFQNIIIGNFITQLENKCLVITFNVIFLAQLSTHYIGVCKLIHEWNNFTNSSNNSVRIREKANGADIIKYSQIEICAIKFNKNI
jgi:hypothetical protein